MNREEQALEGLTNHALQLDDTFTFKCRACGKCCKNRDDILLTTKDLYNIAKHLDRTMAYVLERYCESYIGSGSRFPIVRLKPVGADKICPLLRDKLCIVHEAKPLVCAIFPLGRGVTSVNMGADLGGALTVPDPADIKPIYFHNGAPCGSRSQTHTVQAWLERFGVPLDDTFYAHWTHTAMFLAAYFHRAEKSLQEPALRFLWSVVFGALYGDYVTEKELLPQFLANVAWLKSTLPKLDYELAKVPKDGGMPKTLTGGGCNGV